MEARWAIRRSRTMGRAGLRQRLGVGFDRHWPLSWGSPRELKKKARFRYLLGTRLGTRNKQTTYVANGVRPLEFDLRRGEDFFSPGQVCGGRDEKVSDSGRCRLMCAVSLSDTACSCARIGWTRWRSRRAPRAGALAAWQALFCTAIRVVASSC